MTTSAQQQEMWRQEAVSYQFLARHKDFNNCEANINLIKDYFQEYRLDWTLENLERVFSELKPQLAPVQGAAIDTTQPSAPEPPQPVPAAPVQPTVGR